MCAGAKTSTANGKVEAECIIRYEQHKYTPSSLTNRFAQTYTFPGPFRPIAHPA